LKTIGKIIHKDNDRIIEVINYVNKTKVYKIHQTKRHCFYCNKKVHKDSGGLLMSEKVKKLMLPKFFCNKHYIEVKQLLKQLK
jgi:hypothetical protein